MSDVFVPGKVIISGEHAVVYGKMALAASISLGVSARVVESAGSEKNQIIEQAIELAGGDKNTQVKIESNLPIGSGLGSSAAVCAAVIRGVREHLTNPIRDDELFNLTYECEKIAHGNPSGLDPAVVVYRGLIAYTKGLPFERLELVKPIKLLLINSGKPSESTKEMVEQVARNSNKDKIIEEIRQLTEIIKLSLINGKDISKLINENGILLEELGVVGESARKLSNELRAIGAYVKVTGAGGVKNGSGMMIVVGGDYPKIKKMLDNSQIKYFETVIGKK